MDLSNGVRVLDSLTWEINEAMYIAKMDACPRGFAFWYPKHNLGFTMSTPQATLANLITFYEVLAVLSILDDAYLRFPPGSKVVIYTDNFSTVTMFNSLWALPEYNCILKAATDILITSNFHLRVLHIAGSDNCVADALSRGEFMQALQVQPGLSI